MSKDEVAIVEPMRYAPQPSVTIKYFNSWTPYKKQKAFWMVSCYNQVHEEMQDDVEFCEEKSVETEAAV